MKPPLTHLMRDHLGWDRVDAGRDRDALFGDVVSERRDLPIRVCELARQRQPGLLLGGLLLHCLLLRRPPRFLSSHRLLLVSAYSSSSVTGTPRALARRFSTSRDGFFFFPASNSAK